MDVESEGHNNYLNGQQASYYNTFSCVRKKIPFRPQLSTPSPTISGPQTAIPAPAAVSAASRSPAWVTKWLWFSSTATQTAR